MNVSTFSTMCILYSTSVAKILFTDVKKHQICYSTHLSRFVLVDLCDVEYITCVPQTNSLKRHEREIKIC